MGCICEFNEYVITGLFLRAFLTYDLILYLALFLQRQRSQYLEATRLIREQAIKEPSILKRESRFLIQVWHILVTVLLWASISETYTGNAIRQFVTDIFT